MKKSGKGWVDLAGKKNSDTAMRASGFERVAGDRYWTEPWVTKALLDRVKFCGTIWEPACGRGDMVTVLEACGYTVMASDIAGASLGCENAFRSDFLLSTGLRSAGSIITNPPYTLAEKFIRKALELAMPYRGMVAMLLRNEYDCAAGRRDLFERESFAAKLVLTKRPHWDDGLRQRSASPRHNFAWYVWDWRNAGPPRIGWLP